MTPYPSLAPRAVEKQGFAEPEVPVAVATPDAALDARLAALDSRLTGLEARFATESAAAERAARAAKGARAGSESWITAQTLLAGLDDVRAQTSSVVTDIEQIAIDRAATLAPVYPAVTALQNRAKATTTRQTGTIDRIGASLAPA
ncbi:hypothetical protein ASE75_08190 [Sphingomonas sp. Leaf17]|nr:hypothetical protein ASE75_08190 [Sphingomonas sp. Leaf17]